MSPPMSHAADQAADELAGSPRCAGCGCTTNVACDPPCWWVSGHTAYVGRGQTQMAVDVETRPTPLRELVALCSACAPTVEASLAWEPPRACVAPTWPEWAGDEDGEVLWLRADLVGRAAAITANTGWMDLGARDTTRLVPTGTSMMILNLEPEHSEWEWSIQPAHPEDHDSEQVLYATFEVTVDWGSL